jgi:hypothetical protein
MVNQGTLIYCWRPTLVTVLMMKAKDCQSFLLKTIMSHESTKVLGGNKARMVHQDLPVPKDPKAQEANQVYLVVLVNMVLLEIKDCLEIQVLLKEAAKCQNHEILSL